MLRCGCTAADFFLRRSPRSLGLHPVCLVFFFIFSAIAETISTLCVLDALAGWRLLCSAVTQDLSFSSPDGRAWFGLANLLFLLGGIGIERAFEKFQMATKKKKNKTTLEIER